MKNKNTFSGQRLPSRLLMALCIASCVMPAAADDASRGWLDDEIVQMRAYPRMHRAHQAILKRDYGKAAAALRDYLALRPDDIEARLLYLDVLYRRKDKDALAAQTAKVLAKSPSNAKALAYRQWLAGDASGAPPGRIAAALPAAAPDIKPVKPVKLSQAAAPVRHARARQVASATQVAQVAQVAASAPTAAATEAGAVAGNAPAGHQASQDSQGALARGYAALDEGRPEAALGWFRQALRDEPQASTRIALARTEVALARYDDALEHYAQAAADDALRATADHETGNVLAMQGKLAMAYGYWLLAEREDRSPDLQMQLAYAEAQTGEDQRAITRLEAIDADALPADAQADLHFRLAELYERSGDAGQASRHLMRALPVAPSATGYYRLALYAMNEQDWRQARAWLEHAAAIDASNALVHKQLGYVCKSMKDDACAVDAFESALRVQPAQANVQGELGYAYARLGQNARALDWFRKSIDSYNAGFVSRSYLVPPADNDGGAGDATLSESDAYAIRRQVRDMNRGLQFNAYQSYRPGSGAASTGVAPGFATGGAIPSQGGIELLYQPADIGYRDGRTLRFFARTLWSNRPKSLAIDSDTLQGGVGVEYKPLRDLNAYLSVERLVKIGDQSQDNTLLRASWGYSDGYEMKPGVDQWNYTVAYADLGYLLEKDHTRSAYVELRQGRSFNWQDRWTLTPHLTVAGRAQDPDPQRLSYAEVGAGIAWKVVFNESVYEAPRSSLELALQYRKPLDPDRGSGWVMTAALRY